MAIIDALFGTDAQQILWWQMALRAIVVFAFLLVLLRVGGRRAFGRLTSFDIGVAILLGSTLSRTLTGNARLGPTLAASSVLIGLHWFVAKLAYRRRRVARLLEGDDHVLVQDGVLQEDEMARAAIKPSDLVEALRSSTGSEDLTKVKHAYLERNGRISFVSS